MLWRTAVRPSTGRLYHVYLRASLQFCLVMSIDWAGELGAGAALVANLNSM